MNIIDQTGLEVARICTTFQADHLNAKGTTSVSDHMYFSQGVKDRVTCGKLENSSTDHVPVIVCLETKPKQNHT